MGEEEGILLVQMKTTRRLEEGGGGQYPVPVPYLVQGSETPLVLVGQKAVVCFLQRL
jgi:hypothetical protein